MRSRKWIAAGVVVLVLTLGVLPARAAGETGGPLRQAVAAVSARLDPRPGLNRIRWVANRAVRRPDVEQGAVVGRFQMLHKDHMKYILAAARRCQHLYVGLTNPFAELTREDQADRKRSRPENNPLGLAERTRMVSAALIEAGLSPREFTVVALPVNVPETYGQALPKGTTVFLTAYDAWGRRKAQLFEQQGFKTDMLWERPIEQKGISATEVRRRMAAGEPWEQMVPASVARLAKRWAIPARLRELSTQ